MEALRRQVRRAWRRMAFQQFLWVLPACWTVALVLAAVLIVVDKYWPLGFPAWYSVAGSLCGGLLAALVWVYCKRYSELDAAIEIDRRFGLKERVSSTLAMDDATLASEAGQALLEDAIRRVEVLHVAEHFGVSLSRWSLLPLAPAALAFAVAMFLNPGAEQQQALAKQQAEKKHVKATTEELRRKTEQRRKEAEEKGLRDAERLFTDLEQGLKEMSRKSDLDRKQSLVKLNDLASELQRRRDQLGGNEELKKQLDNQFKNIQQGPGDKMAQALRNGDFKQALNEIKKLQDQLANGQMTEQQKAQLGKQLEQMQNKLQELAKAHQQMQEELKQQIAQKRAAGQQAEAEKLEQQLAKLQQQNTQMQKMQDMANQLGQASEQMKNGQMEQAVASLQSMQGQMESMQQQLDELQMLEEALDQIAQAKNGMNSMDQLGGMDGMGLGQGEIPGFGLGEGKGRGARPEERDNTGFVDSQVKQKIGRGSAQVTDLIAGPNLPGEVQQQIRAQFEAARSEDSDPLTGQQLPREYRDHAKTYFDSFREGK